MKKIKVQLNRLNIIHIIWGGYWLLLLIINLLYFKRDNYPVTLLILWTIFFTISGILISEAINKLILSLKIQNDSSQIVFILIFSFIGAYFWGILEPIISWILNSNINQLNITWDINSTKTFSLTFILAFFSLLYFLRKKEMQKSIQSVEKEESIETISFYHKNQLIILKIDNIKVLEVEGNYTRLTGSNNQTYLLRKSLKKWEQELTQSFFTKVHRSCIINKKYIEKVYVGSNYQLQIQLKDMNEVIEVSKRFTPLLKKHLTTFRS